MTGTNKPKSGDGAAADDLGDSQSPDESVGQDVPIQQEYDQQIAILFQDMRRSSGQSLDSLAHLLETDITLLEALEKGDLGSLPDWGQSSKVIRNYAKLLDISPEPVLRRLALNIQAQGQKVSPDKEVMVDQKNTGKKVVPTHQVEPKKSTPQTVVQPSRKPVYRPVDLPAHPKGSTDAPDIKVSQVIEVPSLSIDKGAVVPILEQPTIAIDKTEIGHKAGGLLGSHSQRVEPTFSGTKNDSDTKLNTTDIGLSGDANITTPPNIHQPEPLRADRRGNFREKSDVAIPGITGLEERHKQGLGLMAWLIIIAGLLAVIYIAWFFSSEPRLGQLLLEQLPFISKSPSG